MIIILHLFTERLSLAEDGNCGSSSSLRGELDGLFLLRLKRTGKASYSVGPSSSSCPPGRREPILKYAASLSLLVLAFLVPETEK
jgi:hypothetical protein